MTQHVTAPFPKTAVSRCSFAFMRGVRVRPHRLLTRTPVGARARSVSTIGTHDGTFHCDEVLGCWMLKQTDRFRDAVVVRTRDEEVLKTLDAVLDVGAVYDPERLRFDHHQRGFNEKFQERLQPGESRVPMSSAGLVYRHFGRDVVRSILDDMDLEEKEIDLLYRRVYSDLIEGIDGMDNGFSICVTPEGGKGILLFSDSTSLVARVGRLNKHWKAPPDWTADGQFAKAMELAGKEFEEIVLYLATKWIPARECVKDSLMKLRDVSSTREIMFLDSGCPWSIFFHDLEEELRIKPSVKYCVYWADDGMEQCFVHATTKAPRTSTLRVPFPNAWRGLERAALEKANGIKGSVFVHRGGFLGSHKTKEGAILMAERSLEHRGRTYIK